VIERTHGPVSVGSAEDNDIVLRDRRVSRHHLVVELGPLALRVRDLGSKNGTLYCGSRLDAADLPLEGALLQVGDSELCIQPHAERAAAGTSQCGGLVGESEIMKRLFARIERVAKTDTTVLIEGETGSGKGLVAEALHGSSTRRDGPLVVVDCASIPRDLVESELFGHVRGAFSGATADRQGAFASADGGSVFIDEIGELDAVLQPRMLRVLEAGAVKPVGSDREVGVSVRVIAATNRDLREEVRAGRFRQDLFFRLSVVTLQVPPLRERLGDVPLLVERFRSEIGAPPLSRASHKLLSRYQWPGNVRQLKNVLVRAAALAERGTLEIGPNDLEAHDQGEHYAATPYKVAKDKMLAAFTRDYLVALLARHDGNVSAAAREAQVDRNWIVALAKRYGVIVGRSKESGFPPPETKR
jgi:transcriptional regulator with GAF, ATPase, and Fis domain